MLQADALRLQTSAELSRQWSNKDGRELLPGNNAFPFGFNVLNKSLSKWAKS
jgi:hypothetical protein